MNRTERNKFNWKKLHQMCNVMKIKDQERENNITNQKTMFNPKQLQNIIKSSSQHSPRKLKNISQKHLIPLNNLPQTCQQSKVCLGGVVGLRIGCRILKSYLS